MGAELADRPRHPTKEFESLLQSLEAQGWRVTKAGKYFKAYCGGTCKQHLKTIRITPSDPRYLQNLMGWLRRSGCWKEAQR